MRFNGYEVKSVDRFDCVYYFDYIIEKWDAHSQEISKININTKALEEIASKPSTAENYPPKYVISSSKMYKSSPKISMTNRSNFASKASMIIHSSAN